MPDVSENTYEVQIEPKMEASKKWQWLLTGGLAGIILAIVVMMIVLGQSKGMERQMPSDGMARPPMDDGGGQPPPMQDRANDTSENTTVVAAAEVVDETNAMTIDLSTETGDLTLTSGGTFILSGNLSGSLIVSAPGETVTLILNGVNIQGQTQAGILGLYQTKLVIVLAEGTENVVADAGASEDYSAAIFSNSELIIQGEGELTVNGTVEEGIATENSNMTIHNGKIVVIAVEDGLNTGGDNGGTMTVNGGSLYVNAGGDGLDSNGDLIINGGTVLVMASTLADNAAFDADGAYQVNGGTIVGLGMGMLESPSANSRQKTLLFNLDSQLPAQTLISLLNESEIDLVTFEAGKVFKTITFSSASLTDEGSYTLYQGGRVTGTMLDDLFYVGGEYTPGTMVTVNGTNQFTTSQTVNFYGMNGMGR